MNLVPILILCNIYIYIYFRQNSLLAGRIIYVVLFSSQQVNSMRMKEWLNQAIQMLFFLILLGFPDML
jgi:hypothetical protein